MRGAYVPCLHGFNALHGFPSESSSSSSSPPAGLRTEFGAYVGSKVRRGDRGGFLKASTARKSHYLLLNSARENLGAECDYSGFRETETAQVSPQVVCRESRGSVTSYRCRRLKRSPRGPGRTSSSTCSSLRCEGEGEVRRRLSVPKTLTALPAIPFHNEVVKIYALHATGHQYLINPLTSST